MIAPDAPRLGVSGSISPVTKSLSSVPTAPASQIDCNIAQRPQTAFDRRPEDPQKQHVPSQMQQGAMQKHRGQQCPGAKIGVSDGKTVYGGL